MQMHIHWLVVSTPLKNMSFSMGRIIPYIMENNIQFQTTNQYMKHLCVCVCPCCWFTSGVAIGWLIMFRADEILLFWPKSNCWCLQLVVVCVYISVYRQFVKYVKSSPESSPSSGCSPMSVKSKICWLNAHLLALVATSNLGVFHPQSCCWHLTKHVLLQLDFVPSPAKNPPIKSMNLSIFFQKTNA